MTLVLNTIITPSLCILIYNALNLVDSKNSWILKLGKKNLEIIQSNHLTSQMQTLMQKLVNMPKVNRIREVVHRSN